jgi:hypothetical protein
MDLRLLVFLWVAHCPPQIGTAFIKAFKVQPGAAVLHFLLGGLGFLA